MSFQCFSRVIRRKSDQHERYVRVRPTYRQRVEIDLGRYAQGQDHAQHVILSPAMARALAKALVQAADETVKNPRLSL